MNESIVDTFEQSNTDYLQRSLHKTLVDHEHFELNPQAISSLDILPKLRSDGLPDSSALKSSRANTTIYSVLNKCRTLSGKRLLSLWLRKPLKSKRDIDRRLDIVEHLLTNNELRTICYDDYLRKIPDLLRVASKISKEKCDIHDLVKIYETYKLALSLCKSQKQIQDISEIESPDAVVKLFGWISEACHGLTDFNHLLEDSLILDKPDENNDYLLKPDMNEDVAKITSEIEALCAKARQELCHTAEDAGLEADKTIKLETDAEKGFSMKVTKQNEQAIRGDDNYKQFGLLKKDGYRFTTNVLTRLSTKYISAKEEYYKVARNVYKDIISQAVMFDDQVLELCIAFSVLDVFVALASSAVQNNYIRPLILDSDAGKIEIDKLRHPCLENQPDIEDYVANDIAMSKAAKKFFIITGPNMGGKSTYIKSVAVSVIMAQCGSMIPAEDGKISVVDGVYTRIGAGDCQAEGISTFMEEMLDMSKILSSASENSLVIVDELGRGTSTFDGFGIAWSIAKHLATNLNSYCLFATHFHELTEMEDQVDTVGNLHVKAYCDNDKLTMLYKVDSGVCDESYGINVAMYTKFPEHVTKMAQEKLKHYEDVPGFDSKQKVREFVREICKEFQGDTI